MKGGRPMLLFLTACGVSTAVEMFTAGAAAGITLLTVGSRVRKGRRRK